jgi:DNA invertase Pin-like site-specific DNA recombinase
MQAITGSARVGPRLLLLAATIALALMWTESAAASTAYTAASAHPHPTPRTGWNGRPIQRPHKPVDGAPRSNAAFPAGWSAGAVRDGTGYHRPGGSERVREVQRRLSSLGYHTGPIDGLYGPLTRSAVQWFQIKHGVRPTGVVAATTLAALRDPKGFGQQDPQAKEPAPLSAHPTTPTAMKQPLVAPQRGDDVPSWVIPALIAALAVSLVVLLTVVRPAARRARARHWEPALRRDAAPAGAVTVPTDNETAATVVGYLPGESPPGSRDDEEAIVEACRRRGWTVARIVREVQELGAHAARRPGLNYALDQLTEGMASRLVVHKLEHIAGSLAELRTVLSWFMRAGVTLTVLDVGLDTGTPHGRMAMRTLLSVCRTESENVGKHGRNALAAARRPGRPAVEDSPELADRIREMRSSGMTLRAIADALNGEGVPTVRGGAEWRPSSVQSVLGYRRTRMRDP